MAAHSSGGAVSHPARIYLLTLAGRRALAVIWLACGLALTIPEIASGQTREIIDAAGAASHELGGMDSRQLLAAVALGSMGLAAYLVWLGNHALQAMNRQLDILEERSRNWRCKLDGVVRNDQ